MLERSHGPDLVAGVAVNLLPYQLGAVRKYVEARRAGKRRILLVLPTGGGKTVILGYLTKRAAEQGRKCLWLVNRRELVAQTVRTLERFGLEVGHSGRALGAAVQVRTYQAAISAGEVPPADVIFADEAHHIAERGEWIAILQAYPEAVVVGATATPERGDGQGLNYFDELVTVAQPSDLVALWQKTGGAMGLVPCVVSRPSRPLKGLARTPAKATIMGKMRDHQQVCFAPHLTAAVSYAEGFREVGMSVELVTGATPKLERDAMLARFAAKETRVIVNCQVLTEGWDCPSVEVITLGGRCGSIGNMIQKTGRGARPSPGKERFVVLDLTGCTWELGHPFEDRTYSLEGEGISGPKRELVRLMLCKRCGAQMPEDSDTCERDGCDWTRPGLEVPKVLEEKLERWEWRRTHSTDDRVTRVAGWIRQARGEGRAGKSVAIAIHKYIGYYHEKTIPRAVISHACAIVNGQEWCARCEHSRGSCRCQREVMA